MTTDSGLEGIQAMHLTACLHTMGISSPRLIEIMIRLQNAAHVLQHMEEDGGFTGI